MMEDAVDDQNELPVVAVEGTFGEDGLVGLRVARSSNEIEAVELADLSSFLEKHAETVFVTCDAAVLHWQIVSALGEKRDCWWRVTDKHRLHDLGLLYQSFQYAKQGAFTGYPTLSKLEKLAFKLPDNMELAGSESKLVKYLRIYLGLLQQVAALVDYVEDEAPISPLQDWSSESISSDEQEVLDNLRAEIIKSLRAKGSNFERNAEESYEISEDEETSAEAAGYVSYGPLGTGIDTKAAIAFHQISARSLAIQRSAAENALQAARGASVQAMASLRQTKKVAKAFNLQNHKSVSEPESQPDLEINPRRDWLEEEAETIRPFSDVRAPLPLDLFGGKRRLSNRPERWMKFSVFNDHIASWCAGAQADRASKFLNSVDSAATTVSFEWKVAPRLEAVEPSLHCLQSYGKGLLRPADGSQFITVSIVDLSIRCWARVLERELYILYSDNYFFPPTTIKTFGLWGFGRRRSRLPNPGNDN